MWRIRNGWNSLCSFFKYHKTEVENILIVTVAYTVVGMFGTSVFLGLAGANSQHIEYCNWQVKTRIVHIYWIPEYLPRKASCWVWGPFDPIKAPTAEEVERKEKIKIQEDIKKRVKEIARIQQEIVDNDLTIKAIKEEIANTKKEVERLEQKEKEQEAAAPPEPPGEETNPFGRTKRALIKAGRLNDELIIFGGKTMVFREFVDIK